MHADDTSISHSSSSLVDISQTLNSELNDLKQWLQLNKLSLKVLRTQALVVGSQRKIKKITLINQLIIHSFLLVTLKLKMFTMYLGVITDRSLNLEEQVNNLRSKGSRVMGFLKYSRNFCFKTSS